MYFLIIAVCYNKHISFDRKQNDFPKPKVQLTEKSPAWSSRPTSVALISPQKTGGHVLSKRTTFGFVNTL